MFGYTWGITSPITTLPRRGGRANGQSSGCFTAPPSPWLTNRLRPLTEGKQHMTLNIPHTPPNHPLTPPLHPSHPTLPLTPTTPPLTLPPYPTLPLTPPLHHPSHTVAAHQLRGAWAQRQPSLPCSQSARGWCKRWERPGRCPQCRHTPAGSPAGTGGQRELRCSRSHKPHHCIIQPPPIKLLDC